MSHPLGSIADALGDIFTGAKPGEHSRAAVSPSMRIAMPARAEVSGVCDLLFHNLCSGANRSRRPGPCMCSCHWHGPR